MGYHKLYVMVSLPPNDIAQAFNNPIILGVFDSKEKAHEAWKNRSVEYKDIKAKSVRVYCEFMNTELPAIPQYVWLRAYYKVYQFSDGEPTQVYFAPGWNGFYEKNEDIAPVEGKSMRETCAACGWNFFCSNEQIIVRFELNKLTRHVVELTDVNKN